MKPTTPAFSPSMASRPLRFAALLPLFGLLCFGGIFAVGCGGESASSRIVRGGGLVTPASATMKREGVVFAPFEAPAFLGAEATNAHYECIKAVNQAVYGQLTRRYQVIPPPIAGRQYGGMPRWARAPSGPHAAIHIPEFRCGSMQGNQEFTLTPTSRPSENGQWLSQVTINVHDRRSGEIVIQVTGSGVADNGPESARLAAESAAEQLMQ